MNYLAHIYLSYNNDKSMIGNLLGDFVRITEDNNYEKSILEGIIMHRKLDSFTDSHTVFLKSKSRISTENKRVAGLLIDMFYDHFLAKSWSEYSVVPLEEYTIKFYQILERASESLPDKLLNVMPMMIKENWLFSYREINGIEKALERISKRLSIQKYSITSYIGELKNNYQEIENDFRSFFPEIIQYAEELIEEAGTTSGELLSWAKRVKIK